MLYLRTLIDLLETLERQAPEGAGTLPVASERNGGDLARIFVDRGQLSWLWCRLGTSSLADFLSGSGSLSAEQISELARESVRDGEPISAKLARRAGLDDKQLREALLSFTADALTHVVKALADGRAHIKPFEPSPAGAFQLRYSFAASEILPRVLAACPLLGLGLEPLPQVFQLAGPQMEAALCFYELEPEASTAVLVGQAGQRSLSLSMTAMRELYQHGKRVLRAPALDGSGQPYAAMVRGLSQGWFCLQEAPFFTLYRTASPSDYGTLLSLLRRERRSAEPGEAPRQGKALLEPERQRTLAAS